MEDKNLQAFVMQATLDESLFVVTEEVINFLGVKTEQEALDFKLYNLMEDLKKVIDKHGLFDPQFQLTPFSQGNVEEQIIEDQDIEQIPDFDEEIEGAYFGFINPGDSDKETFELAKEKWILKNTSKKTFESNSLNEIILEIAKRCLQSARDEFKKMDRENIDRNQKEELIKLSRNKLKRWSVYDSHYNTNIDRNSWPSKALEYIYELVDKYEKNH